MDLLRPIALHVDGTILVDARSHLDRVTANVAVLDEELRRGLVIEVDLGGLGAVRTGDKSVHQRQCS